jgi:hypothetical protein
MTKSLGKKLNPFLGRYKEILITYDKGNLGVEVDGLLPNGNGWENIMVEFDVDDPENFAHGVYDTIKTLFPTLPITIAPQQLIETEGWFLADSD